MKIYEIISIGIGVAFLAWVGYGFLFESGIESPSYKSISSQSAFDIREYKHIQVATVPDTNSSNSFQELFQYINGSNQSQKKIKMTAPVIQHNQTMMFVLPANANAHPSPLNPNVSIETIRNLRVAVDSFNGGVGDANKRMKQFNHALTQAGLSPTTRWFLCQYNSPWVFPAFRKNEIWIELLVN